LRNSVSLICVAPFAKLCVYYSGIRAKVNTFFKLFFSCKIKNLQPKK
jgi:hypothetical protein